MRLTATLIVYVLLLFLVTACQRTTDRQSKADDTAGLTPPLLVRLGPESAEEAVALANDYLAARHPELDVSHKPPMTQYVTETENQSGLADGGPFWMVTYAIPAPPDSIRPYMGFTVYLDVVGKGHQHSGPHVTG